MYAIIRTGGKQYRVEVGQRLRTERLPGADGDIVEFTHVLLIENDGDTTIGTPLISGASVEAEIVSQSRKKAIPVFKYKNKIRYRRFHQHRQLETVLIIKKIIQPQVEKESRRSRKKTSREPEKSIPTTAGT
jgi:large subunit ribosomal protein L21